MEKTSIFKPLYTLTHAPIGGHFSKNSSDFVVREVPLYEFSGEGEHGIIEIQKKDMTTFEALGALSEISGIKIRDFGYAGLKDKEGMTTQFISYPAKFESVMAKFSHEKMKIISATRHNNKLRIGHLKGNNFFIRLKKILPTDAKKLTLAAQNLNSMGYANYFGYQRFGKFGDNAKQGEEILSGELKIKNPKIRDFLISAYQSELFNKWLSKRVQLSRFAQDFSEKEFCDIYSLPLSSVKEIREQKQFFKLLVGDVLGHYPHGKFFLCEDIKSEVGRFNLKDITSCGLLIGNRAYESVGLARKFEDEIYTSSYKFSPQITGSRRYAWCWLEEMSYRYDEEKAHFCLNFFLEKGSYATVILEELLHRDIFEES